MHRGWCSTSFLDFVRLGADHAVCQVQQDRGCCTGRFRARDTSRVHEQDALLPLNEAAVRMAGEHDGGKLPVSGTSRNSMPTFVL
ncbi:MAG: hypothetical protein WAW16_09025 [Candidatus Cryosericum sp.]